MAVVDVYLLLTHETDTAWLVLLPPKPLISTDLVAGVIMYNYSTSGLANAIQWLGFSLHDL